MKLEINKNGNIAVEGSENEIIAAIGKLRIGTGNDRDKIEPMLPIGARIGGREIASICEYGDARRRFRLGDMMSIKHRTLGGSGNTIDCRIVRLCDTGMVIAAIYPITEMQFDAAEKKRNAKKHEHPTAIRAEYGSNAYHESAIRQWLNSDRPKGEWWEGQHGWDNPPEELDKIDGLLAGFDDDFIGCLGYCDCITARPLGNKGESITTRDRFFLPSVTEITGEPNNGVMEGTKFAYADKIAKGYNWLRSPYASYADFVAIVNTSGAFSINNAIIAVGVAPACVIGKIY